MCQITVANLHDEYLNNRMFLFLGMVGSLEHSDGWGAARVSKKHLKTALPMHRTTNAGEVLLDMLRDTKPKEILLGHIRRASPSVPVCDENAHPFQIDGVIFVHNGNLKPKDEKNPAHVLEETVKTYDAKDASKVISKTVKRSDSLVFFEYFMKLYKASTLTDLKTKFVAVLKEAMSEFYGKFAMVFIIEGTYFIVRGKTAELNVTYLNDNKGHAVGWVVNTSGKLLDFATNLVSNLEQLERKPRLDFSMSALLEQETVYVAENNALVKIGTIEENPAPVAATSVWKDGVSNFTGTGGTKIGEINPSVIYAEKVHKFMADFSLTLANIHDLFLALYDVSTLETEEYIVKHFCNVVIPILKNSTTKNLRKKAKANFNGGVPILSYLISPTYEYPWLLETKERQAEFLDKASKSGDTQ